MNKNRLEAFSDGVIAIIITIMVLEIKVPHEVSVWSILNLAPIFLSYLISFIYIGIYWNNHHHLFSTVQRVNGRVLWANLHLLFWLSLIPFASGWMGENQFENLTVTFYGLILFFTAVAYYFLTLSLVKNHGKESILSKAIGNKNKERVSLFLYLFATPISIWYPYLAFGIYTVVAIIWLYPDIRIEKALEKHTPLKESLNK